MHAASAALSNFPGNGGTFMLSSAGMSWAAEGSQIISLNTDFWHWHTAQFVMFSLICCSSFFFTLQSLQPYCIFVLSVEIHFMASFSRPRSLLFVSLAESLWFNHFSWKRAKKSFCVTSKASFKKKFKATRLKGGSICRHIQRDSGSVSSTARSNS